MVEWPRGVHSDDHSLWVGLIPLTDTVLQCEFLRAIPRKLIPLLIDLAQVRVYPPQSNLVSRRRRARRVSHRRQQTRAVGHGDTGPGTSSDSLCGTGRRAGVVGFGSATNHDLHGGGPTASEDDRV